MAKKILLADDSITIQKVIELTFSDEDFDVITVGNGRLALERLPEVRPDIVLCDIIMPEKDGYEVCEQIKSNPAWSHVPVLLLTGAFEPFDQERASRAGYDGSLAKPFEPETLIAKVKDLLARAPARPPSSAPPAVVSAAPVPTVVPFARPAMVPPPVAAVPPPSPLGGGFISDEPFPEIDEPPSAPVSHARPPDPAVPSVSPLAALSEEESAMLSAPPAIHDSEDAASTVMFRPADVPWSTPAPAAPKSTPPQPVRLEPLAPAAPAAPVPAVPVVRVVVPEPEGEPEPRLVREPPVPIPPMADDAPVFEAVLDEDLDFGPAGFEPGPAPEGAGGETLFAPEPVRESPLEPLPEPALKQAVAPAAAETVSSLDELVSAPAAAPMETVEPAFVEESLADAEPARLTAPAPYAAFDPPYPAPVEPTTQSVAAAAPPPAAVPELPHVSAPATMAGPLPVSGPAPVPTPAPEPEAARAAPVVAMAPPPAPPVVAEPAAAPGPLADLEIPADEPQAVPPSQTAAFSVPVDMVEKIAQRVVAQVSEKVVREIAWEVFPDMAEALIKQEIERIKADLQKT
jgi:CheY-like chemotaxis protein